MAESALQALAPRVTVIIPSIGTTERGVLIRRALASVRASSADAVPVVVVVNGSRFDPAVCAWLKTQPDVHFAYSDVPSAPHAVLLGRRLVRTPYFTTIDDDDEFLPGATDSKLRALDAAPGAALVVTDGYRVTVATGAGGQLVYRHLAQVAAAPLRTLLQHNWLHNCNALYRSDRVGAAFFEDSHPYAEWTWLAYRLILAGLQVTTLDQPTFRYHDTQGSLSKSDAYWDAQLPLLLRMLAIAPTAEVRALLRRKLGAIHHLQSARALQRGQRLQAVKHHLQSLGFPGGWRYASYTRRLVPGYPGYPGHPGDASRSGAPGAPGAPGGGEVRRP